MEEINEIILFEEFDTNKLYIALDKNPAAAADITGLKIQLPTSNTIHDTCSSLIRYKIVLSMVVIKSANKYALKP